MTDSISNFFWTANKNAMISILSYELQGEAEVIDATWHNDACPSAYVEFDDSKKFQIFFPSDYDTYCNFVIYRQEEDEEETFIGEYNTIREVVEFFKSI